MTIKELAYSTQQHLQASTGGSFKRAHIYELLAASFGFNSYAAFGVDAVFTRGRSDKNYASLDNSAVRLRCADLGYPPHTAVLVSSALPAFLAERQIGAERISDLVNNLRGQSAYQDESHEQGEADQFDVWANPDDDDPLASIMLEGLKLAASKGTALAHYALALIHAPDEEDEERSAGSDYWHSQANQGRILTGVEKEWADAHAAHLDKVAKHAHHLREAARLGHQDALLELADRFDDPAFFEQANSQVDADPALVAEIAERRGRPNDARKWLTAAAEAGDTEAMRQLIEDYDRSDLQRCWTWVYLAEMVGADLTKDEYHAIHEDGTAYDDDVGGNAFVGGRGGIELAPLSAQLDDAARRAAQAIFEHVE
jgi:hypothetical protein